MKKTIYALGIGHNTPVFLDLALACGYEIAGLFHYNSSRTGQLDHGYVVVGSFDDMFESGIVKGNNFLLTMGDNQIRTELSNRIIKNGGFVPSLVHPYSVISSFAKISEIGVYISPYTYVQADSTIDSNTVLLSHVNISHTTHIGKSCFIAGCATIGAYTYIENSVFVGIGATIISGKVTRIGKNSYVGAGALVTKEVPENVVVAGVPAKIIKEIKPK